MKKRVLIACEYSGIVRDAFSAAGFEAVSCDLLPSEAPGNHYQGDVLSILNHSWDLMIAHPPCQYLSFAGNHVWDQPGRSAKRWQAYDFFLSLITSNIPHIAIENPVGFINQVYRKPDQIVHPYYFGDSYLKRTCLWLKNLPKLDYQGLPLFGIPGSKLKKPKAYRYKNKKVHWSEYVSGSDRQRIRSKTFPGIAAAMADQWGKYIKSR